MTVTPTIATASNEWLTQALTSRLSLVCLAVAVVCVVVLALCVRALGRIIRAARAGAGRRSLIQNTDGTAMIEFTLVFPIALFVSLLLAQTTMLMAGNMFVHYAAFAATRSAIVQIPRDLWAQGEPRNVIVPGRGDLKHEAIRRAAVFALVPAAGKLAQGDAPAGAFVSGLQQWYSSYGRDAPNWVDKIAADRLRYADAYTQIYVRRTIVLEPEHIVTFEDLPQGSPYEFGPKDAVTVRIEHELNLSVPYVGAIYSDGKHATTSGGRGSYTLVNAQYTLSNEGVDTQLPPPTEVPRVP